MSDDLITDEVPGSEPFLSRWSRRKQESALANEEIAESKEEALQEEQQLLTDADMPNIESLDENSDYRGFLSPKVSEALRQKALQKLFLSASFNVCDGLDDYDEDFTSFEKLGDVMTADLRHRLEQEAERAAEKAEQESQESVQSSDLESEEREQMQDEEGDSDGAAESVETDAPQMNSENDEDSIPR